MNFSELWITSFPSGTQTQRQGFTLIEGLVVIVIILILATLSFTALNAFKPRKDLATCATQLAQFGRASLQYANDWNGAMPSQRHLRGDQGPESDFFLIGYLQINAQRYLDDQADPSRSPAIDPYFKCPSMLRFNPDLQLATGASPSRYSYRSQFLHMFTYNSPGSNNNLTYPTTKMNPRRSLLFCGSSGEHVLGNQWNDCWMDITRPPIFPHLTSPSRNQGLGDGLGTSRLRFYTQGTCNVLQFDGSVAALVFFNVLTQPVATYDASKHMILGTTASSATRGIPAALQKDFNAFWYGRSF